MRIHTDHLTGQDIRETLVSTGLHGDGVRLVLTGHGSRSRHHAFEMRLYTYGGCDRNGRTRRHANGGNYGASAEMAATWDEWGILLARLFELDPNMNATYYAGRDDFMDKTRRYVPRGMSAPWLEVAALG
jgi:NADH:ubiquinone oxidoreductase subunit